MRRIYLLLSLTMTSFSCHAVERPGSPWFTELNENILWVQEFLEEQGSEKALQKVMRGIAWLHIHVHLRSNSAEVSAHGREQIYNVAKLMMIYPVLSIGIRGFTDMRGSEEYNLKLSERRVAAVKKVLADAAKINSKRMVSHAYGEHTARTPIDDPEGMHLDRRVTIRFLVAKPYPRER